MTADTHHTTWAVASWGVGAVAVVTAWLLRITTDDAYISFRYADHAADGHGLLFNPGEPAVEGITNFLWTALLSGLHSVGADLVVTSHLLGIASFAAFLGFAHATARRFGATPAQRFAVVVITALNATSLTFATSGLESMAFAAAVTALLFVAVRSAETPLGVFGAIGVSLLAAATVMLRPDGFVALVVAFSFIVWWWRRTAAPGRIAVRIAALLLPGGLIGALWLWWKIDFYGAVVPHTFWVKRGGLSSIDMGVWYIAQFVHTYLLYVPIAVVGFRRLLGSDGPLLASSQRAPAMPLVTFVGLWVAHLVWAGGDYMGFRMLLPIIPPLAVVGVIAASRIVTARSRRAALLGFVLFAALRPLALEATAGELKLRARLDSSEDLIEVSRRLGDAFADLPFGERPWLGVTSAGVIAFESRLPTYDMLALSTPHALEHGVPVDTWPGHRVVASFDAMLGEGVNFVLMWPTTIAPDDVSDPYPLSSAPFGALDEGLLQSVDSRVVFFEFTPGRLGYILYAHPDADTTRRLGVAGFTVVDIDYER